MLKAVVKCQCQIIYFLRPVGQVLVFFFFKPSDVTTIESLSSSERVFYKEFILVNTEHDFIGCKIKNIFKNLIKIIYISFLCEKMVKKRFSL